MQHGGIFMIDIIMRMKLLRYLKNTIFYNHKTNQQKTTHMDINQQSSADHIIEHLLAIEVDGETMEYIITKVGMGEQMLRQLFLSANNDELSYLFEEKRELMRMKETKL